MRRILITFVTLAVAVALPSAGASSVSSQNQRGAFRDDVVQVLTDLKPVADQLAARGLSGAGADPSAGLTRAIAIVKSATPEQLAVLQRALSTYPAWRTLPRTMTTLVDRLPVGDFRFSRTITPDDCPTARAAGITQTDVEIAADVALAADAVLEAIPTDLVSEPVRIIAVAIWAVPQGVLRGFEHVHNIANACDDADHQALVTQNLDVKVSSRATQVSVDSLTTVITNSFTNVLNAITALKTDVDNSFAAVTTQITNVQNSVNTANTNILKLTANVAANNDLNIRLHIEEDLANPGDHPVGLFELPAAQGGYLELTRSIVLDIIQKTIASGQGVGNAQSLLTSGDQLRAAGKFKEAFAAYGKAYQAATS